MSITVFAGTITLIESAIFKDNVFQNRPYIICTEKVTFFFIYLFFYFFFFFFFFYFSIYVKCQCSKTLGISRCASRIISEAGSI